MTEVTLWTADHLSSGTRDTSTEALQERAMEILADGGRINEAAQSCGVSTKTVQRWLDDPACAAYLEYIRGLMRSQRFAKRERHIAEAYDLVHRANIGELAADDPRVVDARVTLRETEHAIYNPDARSDVSIRKRRPGTAD